MPGAIDVFYEFAASEFSGENVMFYTTATKFAAMFPDSATTIGFAGQHTTTIDTKTTAVATTPATATTASSADDWTLYGELLKEALLIHSTYLQNNAPFEINIGATTREQAGSLITSLRTALTKHQSPTKSSATLLPPMQQLKTVFDASLNEVTRLLQADTFLRFRASPAFTAFADTWTTQHKNAVADAKRIIVSNMRGSAPVSRHSQSNGAVVEVSVAAAGASLNVPITVAEQHQQIKKNPSSRLGNQNSNSKP